MRFLQYLKVDNSNIHVASFWWFINSPANSNTSQLSGKTRKIRKDSWTLGGPSIDWNDNLNWTLVSRADRDQSWFEIDGKNEVFWHLIPFYSFKMWFDGKKDCTLVHVLCEMSEWWILVKILVTRHLSDLEQLKLVIFSFRTRGLMNKKPCVLCKVKDKNHNNLNILLICTIINVECSKKLNVITHISHIECNF